MIRNPESEKSGQHVADATSRFLVVFDEPDGSRLTAMSLAKEFPHGEIIECHSGSKALDLLKTSHVDGVISNHKMTEMDGLTLARKIRATNQTIPIIMVTAMSQIRHEAIEAGVTRFLSDGDWKEIGRVVHSLVQPANP